ncbi:hypothetical protein AMJ39_08800 [candidate division TA06 bacterium DG_24]|uniref:N-acetyltransferase domain-containing protein n=3 Tax=Bacteria division TA06 TaxID=1156500 RepID=A0A0S8JGR2_UNCT6|nr:MAG: hypothetical protein AMJ39_08800 [candidate division TA06 bacterium DG_24]KPK66810.1 MAG: hypothetical protein AMJ82_11610 [candidate division TA06 bacterium SM23_40]KPL08964.1 MAG: hypothetical protein AMJ71_07690 [candidate division TA06 bacterium SM1_40]
MSIEEHIDGLALRPATLVDADFLFALKRTTLGEYIARTWGVWDETWQRAYFDQQFEPSGVQIVQFEGEDIGMISVREDEDALFLELVEILPEHQNRGIGTFLIRQVVARARAQGVAIRLHVLKVNPARRLYERLGFRVVRETKTHYVMEAA